MTFSSGGAGGRQEKDDLTPSIQSSFSPEISKKLSEKAVEICVRLHWVAFHCISACSAYVPQNSRTEDPEEEL